MANVGIDPSPGMEIRRPSGRRPRRLAVPLLGGLLAAGLGTGAFTIVSRGGNTEAQDPVEQEPSGSTNLERKPFPFKVDKKVSLPASILLLPTTMTVGDCNNRQPQETLQYNPNGSMFAFVDGRCREPLGSNEVGLIGSGVILRNGDAVQVTCVTNDPGHEITDVAGNSSSTFLGVVTVDQETGYLNTLDTLGGYLGAITYGNTCEKP